VASTQKSLRVPEEVARAIEAMAESARRDFSSVANEMLEEAVKMRRCPGITFADGATGRRARVAGTGLDVWEVIATYESLERDVERLRSAYDWLSELQLRAALGYYAAYPKEIEEHIARNQAWTRERLAQQHPTLLPISGHMTTLGES
jgi:uncharacterized protein (DUF433 family)